LLFKTPSNSHFILRLRKSIKENCEGLLYYNIPIISTKDIILNLDYDFSFKINQLKSASKRKNYNNINDDCNLIPATELRTHFLSAQDWKKVDKLPSILRRFERYVICQNLIVKINIKIPASQLTKQMFNNFILAISHPDLNNGESFEKLETLGNIFIY